MAEDIIGLSSMATRQVLADLAAEIRRAGDLAVRFTSAGGVEVARRVREGAAADLVVLADTAMADLDRDGFLVAGSMRAMFVSEVVAAVPAALEPPSVATESDLADALGAAARIAYSTGPSGTALLRLLERWGLSDRVSPRLVEAPPGVPVGELLRRGEADLGFQQRSELMDLDGVLVLGPLPGDAAIRSTFTGGVLTTSQRPAGAAEALSRLTSGSGKDVARSRGMEVVTRPR